MFKKPLFDIFPSAPADLDPALLDAERVPSHIAVIMDGNGRWAKLRGKKRLEGHRAGIEAVRETIRCANDVGVEYLTIYSFSTENWKRPADEVGGLMGLFAKTMLAETEGLHEEGVRVMTIGDMQRLPAATRNAFEKAKERTRQNDGMRLVIAANYGGRAEILRAANACVREAIERGEAADSVAPIGEAEFSSHLWTAGIPDPDLVIRTSGEMRVSNFLLWQIAYAEFVCSDALWPDFDRYELLRCLLEYQGRRRRYGAVS